MQEGYSSVRPDTFLGFGAGMGLPNMKRYTDSMEINSTVGVGTDITMKVMLWKNIFGRCSNEQI